MIHPLRALPAALAAALALALAGCGEDPEPTFALPEETTRASGDSGAPSEPSNEPSSALSSSPQDVVSRWIAARNKALDSGNTEEVQALGTTNCRSCTDLIDPIERVYQAGGAFDTDGWSIADTNVKQVSNQRALVQVAVDMAGGRTTPKSGSRPVAYPPEKRILEFKVVLDEQSWAVDEIVYLS